MDHIEYILPVMSDMKHNLCNFLPADFQALFLLQSCNIVQPIIKF